MSRFVLTAQLQLQAPNNVQAVVRQIQQQLQGVTANVNVQVSAQAQRQLQQVTQQTNAATSAAERMGRAFALSVRRFAAFSVATRGVSLFTSTLSNAVSDAIKFERQLVKVSQVTGKTLSQLRFLTKEINGLATSFGVVSSDLLEVSTVLAQAGLSANDTTIALKTLAKAALAPNFDSISETAEGAIAILAQFQEGVGSLEKQLGSINAVAGAFAVEAGDLIDVIRRTGGVFKSSGGSLNELLALFTSVRATTRESAESIGTGLRTIFTRIQRPKTIEFLKEFGVELVDLQGKFVGPFEAIRRLSDALSGLGEGDITFIRIAEELGGFRQIGKVLPLLQQFRTAQQALNVAQNAGNSLTTDAATAQQALAIRIVKVKEEFLSLIRSVTETTTFQVMANTALSLASALIQIGDAIKPLLPMLAAVAAIRFTQGIGTFIGGAMRGVTSGRTYSTGGKVHHFARGGFVPGTGNRDTVPAMLQPGEFVIRKSSVNKLGASNLAAMNENRLAKGGKLVKDIASTSGASEKFKNSVVSTSEQPFRQGSAINSNDMFHANLDWKPISKAMVENDIKNKKVPSDTLQKLLSQSNAEKGDAFETYLSKSGRTNLKRTVNPIYPVDFTSGIGKYAEAKNIKTSLPDSVYLDKLFRARVWDKSYSSLKETPSSKGDQNIDLGKLQVFYRKFAEGGLVNEQNIGAAILESTGFNSNNKFTVSRKDIESKLPKILKLNEQYPIKAQKTLTLQSEGLSGATYEKFKSIIDTNLISAAENSAIMLGSSLGLAANKSIPANESQRFLAGVNDASVGNLFEDTLKVLSGPPFSSDPQRSFDFTNGLSNILKDDYRNLTSKYIDAKSSSKRASTGWETKIANTLASEAISNNFTRTETQEEKKARESSEFKQDLKKSKLGSAKKKFFGGIVQKFAVGGEAQKVANMMGKGKALADSWWTGMFAGNNVLFDWAAPTKAFKIPTGEEVPIDQNLRKVLREKAQREWMAFADKLTKERDAKKKPLTPEEKASLGKYSLSPEQLEKIKKEAEAKKAKAYVDRTSGINWDVENSGRRRRRPEDYMRRFRGFATGGSVGTDTVPALLTPGEFVVNKKSAQAIGYGSLNRMNKVGKYAKGGVVNGQNVQGFRFGGQVAEKNIADSFNREGYALVTSMTEVQKIFDQFVGDLTTLPSSLKKIVSEVETFQLTKNDKFKTNAGERSGNQLRGISLGGKVGINIGQAGTHTVKHEASHEVDQALGGGKGKPSSRTAGTFQHKIATELQKTMEKELGVSAYRLDLAELFADALAKVPPEVKKILVSTTDAAEGSKKLAEHFNKVGGPVAGLADLSADEFGGTQSKRSSARGSSGSSPRNPTRAQSAARSQAASSSVSSGGGPPGGGGGGGGPPGGGGGGGGPVTSNTQAVVANTKAQQGAAKSAVDVVSNNKMFAASMVTSLIAGFLPAVDENSGAMLRMTHSLLGLVTTITGVGFALEALGVQLSKGAIMDFFKGKGIPGSDKISKGFNTATGKMGNFGRVFGASTQAAARGGNGLAAGSKAAARAGYGGVSSKIASNLGNNLGKLSGHVSKMLGPALGVGLAFKAATIMIDSFNDYQGQLNKAIQQGNITKAEENAANLAASEAANTAGMALISVGAAFGPLGLAIGAASASIIKLGTEFGLIDPKSLVDFMIVFGGNTYDSTVALASAQAGAVKTQKALEQAQKTATSAMEDFTNGNTSASDALNQIRAVTAEVSTQQKRAGNFAKDNLENRANQGSLNGVRRNVLSFLSFGAVESVSQRNQRLGKESAEQINQAAKFQQEAFNIESSARQASIRSGVIAGRNPDEIRKEATGSLLSGIKSQQQLGRELSLAGDEEGSKAAFAAADQIEKQLQQVNKEIANIEKEVKRQKELYNAMNLGLRPAIATANALSSSLERLEAGFEIGGSTVLSDINFLETALSSAAQAMNPDDINKAIENVGNSLSEFGVSDLVINKFKGNVNAFVQAQQNYNDAVGNIKDDLEKTGKYTLSPEDFQKRLADELTKGMADGQAKENLKKVIEGLELSSTEVDEILSGNFSILGDKLSETQKKQIEDIQKIAAERQKAEQILINFLKKRIDAERQFVEAQQQAIDLIMEGREIQGRFGGTPVTNRERTGAALARSNAQSNRLGLTNLRTGDAGELRRRNQEIINRFASIEQRRRTEGGMKGREGVEVDEFSRDLQKAQQEQISTIRALIKIQEDELKLIQEKNKLEKSSLESLIKGDIESFFKQQSAVGARAAIASGSSRLQGFYGADALGTAFEDIQKQQEAGVQTLFGQRLAGPGGLTERAAGTALGSRGISDLRSAQVLAGTTGEEEAAKARLRELGGVLGETGQLGADIASMQVETSVVNLKAAEVKFAEVLRTGNESAAKGRKRVDENVAGMYRGGTVYANRGIFVPRGTDTVPAMLTPGEFVVNRAAVQRGNNLQILRAMNNGSGGVSTSGTALMSRGGTVRYRANGSNQPEPSSNNAMSDFAQALNNFNRELSNNITKLKDIKISIKLDTTNVNVNLNNVQFLSTVQDSIKKGVLTEIRKELDKYATGSDGKLSKNEGILPRATGL